MSRQNKSVEDIKTFFHHFVDERKVNFYPDDDFADYICYDDKTLTFSKEDVGIYNRLMGEEGQGTGSEVNPKSWTG